MARGIPYMHEGFTGGLNSVSDPYQLADNESRGCLNVISTQRGSIRKRFGSSLFNKENETPNLELVSLAPVNISGTLYLIASGGKNLYSINAAKEVSTIKEGLTEGLKWSICQAPKGVAKTAGPVYLCNGVDKSLYWTGAAKNTTAVEWEGEKTAFEGKEMFATAPYVPQGKYMIFANERVWMAGMSNDTSAVRFSELKSIGAGGEENDPTLWPAANVVRFDPSDGNPITGIGVVGPYVLVFKASKCWAIHNAAPIATRKISDSVGCVSHRSITESPQGTFFLTAEQGVYLTDGSKLHEMSYNVRPTILAINPAKRENAAGVYFGNHYYLSYASGTSVVNNKTLDYDVQLKSWWPHDLAGNQWVLWEPTAGEPFLYTIPAKTKAGVVKAFDPTTYQDSGANYTGNGVLGAYWLSAWTPFFIFIARHRVSVPHLKKRVRMIFFNGSGEIVASVYKNFAEGERQEPGVVGSRDQATEDKSPINFGTGAEKWAEGSGRWGTEVAGTEILWGGETAVGAARIYAPGVANLWSVGWGNNSKEPFTVDAFTYLASMRKS